MKLQIEYVTYARRKSEQIDSSEAREQHWLELVHGRSNSTSMIQNNKKKKQIRRKRRSCNCTVYNGKRRGEISWTRTSARYEKNGPAKEKWQVRVYITKGKEERSNSGKEKKRRRCAPVQWRNVATVPKENTQYFSLSARSVPSRRLGNFCSALAIQHPKLLKTLPTKWGKTHCLPCPLPLWANFVLEWNILADLKSLVSH